MSIATFESPQAPSQQFFSWVFDEDPGCDFIETEFAYDCEAETKVEVVSRTLLKWPAERTMPSAGTIGPVIGPRLGTPVRLGAVMLKLLKSYGITDEEIAEGIAAYAAKSVA